MFMKSMTAAVLAMSLTLGSLAPTQAQAAFSEEDAVVGLLTLLLLGAAIHHSRDDDAPAQPAVDPNQWREVPVQCLRRDVRRSGDPIRYFAKRCMEQRYEFQSRLPQRCHVRFRNDIGQPRSGWRARCLRNAGFHVQRH